MRTIRSTVAAGAVGLLTLTALVVGPSPGATAAVVPDCSDFSAPVTSLLRPINGANFLGTSTGDLDAARADDFTDSQGTLLSASTSMQPGLVAVRQLYRPSPGQDYLFTTSQDEVDSAVGNHRYSDQGVAFYASPVAADCLDPVSRYRKGTKHRLAVSDADKAELSSSGWTSEGVSFYAADGITTPNPVPVDEPSGGAFKFAVIPDTQNEVLRASDQRMQNRNQWLVRQNVEFATQTGDLVNWDTPDHSQLGIAKVGMDVLEDAGIPYTIAIGNHDTQATGVGGAARDPSNTRSLQRDTTVFNRYFTASDFGSVGGSWPNGTVDNVYSTYSAGGLKWMMVTLEFCPRPAALNWAKQVIEDHPDYNVMISTHSYQNGDGGIDSSDSGYGDLSGQEVFDQLVSQYPNVKMVFSGHVGLATKARIDTGASGNKIYSFLTTMHDPTMNPVRILEVDPAKGTIKTSIYAPSADRTWSQFSETLTGVTFVK